MGTTAKRAMAVVVGLLSSMIALALALLEFLNSKVFPFPEDINPKDPIAIIAAIAAMPLAAKVLQLINYFISAIIGGLVATKIINTESRNPALIIGSKLIFLGLVNRATLGKLIWMAVCSILVYLPGAYLGYRLLARNS